MELDREALEAATAQIEWMFKASGTGQLPQIVGNVVAAYLTNLNERGATHVDTATGGGAVAEQVSTRVHHDHQWRKAFTLAPLTREDGDG